MHPAAWIHTHAGVMPAWATIWQYIRTTKAGEGGGGNGSGLKVARYRGNHHLDDFVPAPLLANNQGRRLKATITAFAKISTGKIYIQLFVSPCRGVYA